MKSSFVYFAKDRFDVIKIGRSGSPGRRMYGLSREFEGRGPFSLLGIIETEDAVSLESCLHGFFSEYRLFGEFFKIPDVNMNLRYFTGCGVLEASSFTVWITHTVDQADGVEDEALYAVPRGAVMEKLHKIIADHGSQVKAAKYLGINVALLRATIYGERELGPTLLSALGYERAEQRYREVQDVEI